MIADGAGELPTSNDDAAPDDLSTGDDRLSWALRGGVDAVFVVRVDDGGDLVAELANGTARMLFGFPSDDGAAPALGASCPPSARPILHSLAQAAPRSRATRETLLLPAPDGGRIAVDLHFEPLPSQRSGGARVLAVVRANDPVFEPGVGAGSSPVEVFDDTMRARALTAHATENALHRALERGEFQLFFQPIVGLSDAGCVGAEALLRWQHPERGLLPPAEFVPLAEETGLVVEIGWWVLEEAARNAARWQLEQTEPFQVSVNLSARQLAQPDLPDRVAEVIAETGVQPSSLCFEITESVLMDDAESVLDRITRVRSLGVQFAIDDFGTGHSSLGYLKRFPVDSVKIDRSFISGLGSDAGDAAIVSAVIGLAHALGLRVTAEGVETEEQLMALIALECDEAQGYFFSPPQPAPDLRGLIARTRTWRPPGAEVMRPADGLRRKSADQT